jgi:hypothetical protein
MSYNWRKMTSNIKDNRKKYDEKLQEIEQLAGSFVLVGFQEGSITKSQTKGNRAKKPGLSMPQIAAQNEFGTKEIPARPFLRPAIDENIRRINQAILGEYDKIMDGTSTVKRSLNLIGLFGVDLVQTKIRSIYTPPNSAKTIVLKRSSKPLIDFGQMIQSVRHKVVIA